jgi:hypothetical protein
VDAQEEGEQGREEKLGPATREQVVQDTFLNRPGDIVLGSISNEDKDAAAHGAGTQLLSPDCPRKARLG